MNIDVLYRTLMSADCFDAYLHVEGQQALLGLLYDSTSPDAPIQRLLQDESTEPIEDIADYQILLSMALINVQEKRCESITIYPGTGPGPHSTVDALVRYDPAHGRWVIMQLQNLTYLILRTLTSSSDDKPVLTPPFLLDADKESQGFNALLDLEIADGTYAVFCHKPVLAHARAAQIHRLAAAPQPEWDTLKELMTITRKGTEIERPVSWAQWIEATQQQEKHYFLPENVSFDPGDLDASRSRALRIPGDQTLAATENAMTIAHQETRLLILCSPESWIEPASLRAKSEQTSNEEWRIWLTGWERQGLTYKWNYTPGIGLPIDQSIPSYDAPVWPTVHIAAIAGPVTLQQRPSFVVAMTMLKAQDHQSDASDEEGEILSHAVCLDHNGQMVQTCISPLGLYPRICQSGQIVVGVDRFEGGWRLWNWFVLHKDMLDIIIPLDASCKRAFVHTETASASFWLVEELETGVRVSQRDAATLEEIEMAAFLPDVHLQQDQENLRPLDGYREVGAIPFQGSLLLLVKDENEALVLYRIY
ncbi:MAG TPA: hypothetical protein VL485_21445 [Ktedonobacteraceae bacterium]|jgi:hypothetical protein|nr:hypothetical protein [Ktedonobacteraceae bacterium]